MFFQCFSAPETDFDGSCHFNPPILDSENDIGWPLVAKEQWCGRFEPVDNLTAVEWIAWKKGLLEDANIVEDPESRMNGMCDPMDNLTYIEYLANARATKL